MGTLQLPTCRHNIWKKRKCKFSHQTSDPNLQFTNAFHRTLSSWSPDSAGNFTIHDFGSKAVDLVFCWGLIDATWPRIPRSLKQDIILRLKLLSYCYHQDRMALTWDLHVPEALSITWPIHEPRWQNHLRLEASHICKVVSEYLQKMVVARYGHSRETAWLFCWQTPSTYSKVILFPLLPNNRTYCLHASSTTAMG